MPGDDAESLASVTVRVRNVGPRAGREVVQLYLTGPSGDPVLAGFAGVAAAPGEVADAVVPLPRRVASTWQRDARAWRLFPGPFLLAAGPLTITIP